MLSRISLYDHMDACLLACSCFTLMLSRISLYGQMNACLLVPARALLSCSERIPTYPPIYLPAHTHTHGMHTYTHSLVSLYGHMDTRPPAGGNPPGVPVLCEFDLVLRQPLLMSEQRADDKAAEML